MEWLRDGMAERFMEWLRVFMEWLRDGWLRDSWNG